MKVYVVTDYMIEEGEDPEVIAVVKDKQAAVEKYPGYSWVEWEVE